MNYDTKKRFERIGDRTFKTVSGRYKFGVLFMIIIMLGYTIAGQIQDYIKSFATTKTEMVAKFYPIENVPTYKITFN